jgi:hypothetical protein
MLLERGFYLGDFTYNLDYIEQPVQFDSNQEDDYIDKLFSDFDREHIFSFLRANKGMKFTQEQLLDELSKLSREKEAEPVVISSIVSPKVIHDQFMFKFGRNLMMMADERLIRMQSIPKDGEVQIFFWVEV